MINIDIKPSLDQIESNTDDISMSMLDAQESKGKTTIGIKRAQITQEIKSLKFASKISVLPPPKTTLATQPSQELKMSLSPTINYL